MWKTAWIVQLPYFAAKGQGYFILIVECSRVNKNFPLKEIVHGDLANAYYRGSKTAFN